MAIASFPSPKNITDLRSFLGLANQLAFFLPDFSHLTSEMRKLLSTKNAFLWLETHQNEFEKLKQVLTSDLLVKTFDPKLPTKLLTDASLLNGLGYTLLQKETDSKLRLITCGSCSLSEPKTAMPQLNWNVWRSNMPSQNVGSTSWVCPPLIS